MGIHKEKVASFITYHNINAATMANSIIESTLGIRGLNSKAGAPAVRDLVAKTREKLSSVELWQLSLLTSATSVMSSVRVTSTHYFEILVSRTVTACRSI